MFVRSGITRQARVFGIHNIFAVKSFEPTHREVGASYSLKMRDELLGAILVVLIVGLLSATMLVLLLGALLAVLPALILFVAGVIVVGLLRIYFQRAP